MAAKPVPTLVARLQNKSVYIAVAALLIVVGLCYVNALSNGFVFDDHGHVLEDKSFRSLANVPKILVASYRPLRDVTYAIDFAIWGERAVGFHLTSVLLHLANTLLVFVLIRKMTRETMVACFAAFIFAVQPVQVDSVTYISGRRDVLFSLFFLASFLCYLAYRRVVRDRAGRRYRLRSLFYFGLFGFFWGLSLLSKEMAASMPLFIFVWNFCDAWNPKGESWPRRFFGAVKKTLARDKWLYLALCVVAPVYIWYQVFYKGGSARASISGFEYWGGSFYTNLLTSIRVHAWYLKQLVVPTPIVQYQGAFDIATTLFAWKVILAIMVVGATVAGGFVLLNKDKLMAFAVLSFFALLVPVAQIIPHQELLADHYLYLPMMCFGLFAALLARRVADRGNMAKRVTCGVAAGMLIVFAVMTSMRNTVYKDDLSLWKTNYKEVPNSVRAVSSLAGHYATSYPARGAELYKQCIELDPSYAPAYVSLALLYKSREKAREAEELIQQGLTLPDSRVISPGYENPNRFRSELTTALAISKGFQGYQEEAEQLLLKAITLYPVNSQPYGLLAAYYHAVNPPKETEMLKRQSAVFPNDFYALQSLSSRLIEYKQYDEALRYLNRMIGIDPNDFYANYQLGQIYRTKHDCTTARRYLLIANSNAASTDDQKAIQDALKVLQQECGGS
ncbi:MAG TPA: hypothetical protein VGL29_09250 [Blastocatellia bacterium]